MAVEDEDSWRRLWAGYNAFYQRTVEERVTRRTWATLVAAAGEPHGFVATCEGRVVGFAHYFFVPSTSDWAPRCYLQDLFADPDMRGGGIGRALIETVYDAADRHDAAQVYWLTAADNYAARRLYDRVATLTPFVKYRR
ncbi:GNAT family N-acetyltransferase [Pseudooceanicola sp. LIPI14-2-Ac024]|uniref:GNAT family N-acetyltransferase n=1 Tax=Pseudooceanicola sp. LIPI14-2-Ac024 TaxID=3344875 RepID=UPI0035CF1765